MKEKWKVIISYILYVHIIMFFTVWVGIIAAGYECGFCTSQSDFSETLLGIKGNKTMFIFNAYTYSHGIWSWGTLVSVMKNSCMTDGWTVCHLEMSLENPRVLLTSVFFLSYCSHDLFFKKMVVWLWFGSKSGVLGNKDPFILTFMYPFIGSSISNIECVQGIQTCLPPSPRLCQTAHICTLVHICPAVFT